MYLSLSVYVCLCLSVSIRLGHCHHQMISFQKIYGLYGLKHHTIEINADVTMETNKQTTISENSASQQIDQGLLTFANRLCNSQVQDESRCDDNQVKEGGFL